MESSSYLSPLLKSITSSNRVEDVDRAMIGVDLQQRQHFIAALESRFFFLAADARSTLRLLLLFIYIFFLLLFLHYILILHSFVIRRGWRPSYRSVLLQLRKKLNITCSTKLSTQDLELEIFLHLLHYNSGFVTFFFFSFSEKKVQNLLYLYSDDLKLQYSCREESGNYPGLLDTCTASDGQGSLQFGLSQWKVQSLAALKVGAEDLRSIILKVT